VQTDERELSDSSEATAEWLTGILQAGGFLHGAVKSVRADGHTSVHAHTARLKIAYSADVTGKKPASLFLKICKEGSALFGDSEIRYYTAIAADMASPPIPRCYHSAYDPQTARYHLLLQDLTDTHQVNWGVTPTLPHAAKIIDALAQLHAHWWDSSQLSAAIGRYPNADVMERYISHALPGVAPLLEYLGDRLTGEEREIVRSVFAKHPILLHKRAEEGRHFTCIHGDPNPGNILSPIDADGRAYLIDRQPFPWSLTTWLGVSDLAYLMVHWWGSDVRRELEEPLLRRYWEQLQIRGVGRYAWQRLWEDYRLVAMQSFYVVADWNLDPAEQKQMEWVWWPQLQMTLRAYRSLNCADLLADV